MNRTGLGANKKEKREMRALLRLTRPPRLEGKVKEAMLQPIRKKQRARAASGQPRELRGLSERQRKDYQRKSKHH